MKSIYITGYMGAGKTTVGKVLAEKTGLPVYDTDEEIIKAEQRPIADIFARDGEAHFRKLEREMLAALPAEDCIITTGGGIILMEENRRLMQKQGWWVFLECSLEEIADRLKDDETRPLLSGSRKKELASIYASRLPYYREAGITIQTSGITPEETAYEIIRQISQFS